MSTFMVYSVMMGTGFLCRCAFLGLNWELHWRFPFFYRKAPHVTKRQRRFGYSCMALFILAASVFLASLLVLAAPDS